MKQRILIFLFWGTTTLLGIGTILNFQKVTERSRNDDTEKEEQTLAETQQAAIAQTFPSSQDNPATLAEPIAGFRHRITKKPFGIYITPQTSPVQRDKFKGYHAGVDVEYEGVTSDAPVKAVSNGVVVFSTTASGYGGVTVIRHAIHGQNLFVLYGHLDPKSMLPPRTEVTKGEVVGILGEGYSEETDGARKHLHFAILKKNSLDIRGYVQKEEELEGWYDPVEFYNTFRAIE